LHLILDASMNVRNTRRAPNEQEDRPGNLGEFIWELQQTSVGRRAPPHIGTKKEHSRHPWQISPSTNVALIDINAVAAGADSSAT
jgi:hypothetical protein